MIQGYGASDYGALASNSIDDPPKMRLAGVGRPLPGTELRICDEHGTTVDPGVSGRIFARGPHCVGGFVQDEAATAEAWASGYYATGDFGCIDDDGYLSLSGRVRDLIVRGGQNIVPAEIENALLSHPAVAEVSIFGIPDSEMGEHVCAAIVPQMDASVTLNSITAHLNQLGLARFKHPKRILVIESMPLNPAKTKIDKRILRQLAVEQQRDKPSYK